MELGGKMKKILILIVCVFCLTGCGKDYEWDYDLPNNYVIRKINANEVVLGVKSNNDLMFENGQGSTIGVQTYIAEFKYGKNFIVLKCLVKEEENINILFYIIDSNDEDVYGPYSTENAYEISSTEIIGNEKLSDWISTSTLNK